MVTYLYLLLLVGYWKAGYPPEWYEWLLLVSVAFINFSIYAGKTQQRLELLEKDVGKTKKTKFGG